MRKDEFEARVPPMDLGTDAAGLPGVDVSNRRSSTTPSDRDPGGGDGNKKTEVNRSDGETNTVTQQC